ncbi:MULTISPECIES: hypothetical protein [Carnobacterium]|uniref:Uncharacterized protein n=2 Tax=Carnobacterium divergens TaxID=2748 RepID=A0A0R2HWU7_CARDV|nr:MULTISPECIES: hypothetical protein [Carnobacterium]ANZ99073.1 hypothetical protein BFC22_02660 [Carnobacterium divergens]KRN57000.1 hypothetical protein IV74_GL000650 [Carnobacterium divergens DSM 20623]MCO6018750.1 hypothetical protein [Carnobacterium divergens]MDO0874776.1 hypothetical protein [Carnobacterium divergens]MDT1939657.1 hypothetical protein [Carnobacterium divergens]
MKKIEDYWNDVLIYSVVFTTIEERMISKILIFPMDYTMEDIHTSIMTNFENIKCVDSVDEYMFGMALKNKTIGKSAC